MSVPYGIYMYCLYISTPDGAKESHDQGTRFMGLTDALVF